MTATVKAMDSQRWICRTHLFQFMGPPSDDSSNCADRALSPEPRQQISFCPRQNLLELREELLPACLGAAEGLLLLRPEAGLFHTQMCSCPRRGKREGHDALQIEGRIVVRKIPCVRERL